MDGQQGMPGRVFRSQVPEYREDVASLDSTLFLRKVRAIVFTCGKEPTTTPSRSQ